MRHHYLPKFYLCGFTRARHRDDSLWVFDKSSAKQWKSTPANSAHQRDYYRVELQDGGDPNAFEKSLAWVEDRVAPAVRRVIASQTVPTGDGLPISLLHMTTEAEVAVVHVREVSTP